MPIKRPSHIKNSSGDTIVEVLVALAIVSLILSASYATANRSFLIARQSQERGEALKLVEGQIEKLKSLAATGSGVFKTDPVYCLSGLTIKDFPSGWQPAADINADNFSDYATAGCQSGLYNYSIVYSSAGTEDLFTIRARWNTLGRNSRDELRIVYKLHP